MVCRRDEEILKSSTLSFAAAGSVIRPGRLLFLAKAEPRAFPEKMAAVEKLQSGDESSLVQGQKVIANFRSSRFRSWLLGLILIASTILVYHPAWNGGFIWDDDDYVTANALLTAPDGLRRIWFSLDSPSQYFPLVYTTFRIERGLWGLNPSGYHWVNILLHAANALLVWRLLSRLQVPGAWTAAMIFALHPVQVESVAWITERKNVLMGFFFLLTLLGWIAFLEEVRSDDGASMRWL